MNKISLKIILILTGVFLTTGLISGQQPNEAAMQGGKTKEGLTKEQTDAIKAVREKRLAFRNEFRETLTGNQLDILTNPNLTRQQKMKSLNASLTAPQKRMIRTQRKQIRSQNNYIRSTFSEQQRIGIRRMAMNKIQQNKASFQRVKMQKKRMGI